MRCPHRHFPASATRRACTTTLLDRIAEVDADRNAFIEVIGDEAVSTARRLDRELAAGRDRGPLHGIPVAIKNVIDVAGIRTTAGVPRRGAPPAVGDATVVQRLRTAGAVVLGLTTSTRWPGARRRSTPTSARSPTRGRPTTTPVVPAAGRRRPSRTGWHSRQSARTRERPHGNRRTAAASRDSNRPSAPSRRRASRRWYGAWDHIGTLTRDVADAAVLLPILAGPDEDDPSAHDRLRPVHLGDAPPDVTVGVPGTHFFEGGDAEIVDLVRAAIDALAAGGAHIVEVDVPDAEHAVSLASEMFAEAYAAHEQSWRDDPTAYSERLRSPDATLRHR